MTTIGKKIKATHTYWAGTSVSEGFLFEVEFSISTKNRTSTFTTREDSRKEAEHFVSFQENSTTWSINGIEMPALLHQSWVDKGTNIYYQLVDAIMAFFQNKLLSCDVSMFNGNWGNTTGKLAKMLDSIQAFDDQIDNTPRLIEWEYNKETKSGIVRIVSRKDF